MSISLFGVFDSPRFFVNRRPGRRTRPRRHVRLQRPATQFRHISAEDHDSAKLDPTPRCRPLQRFSSIPMMVDLAMMLKRRRRETSTRQRAARAAKVSQAALHSHLTREVYT